MEVNKKELKEQEIRTLFITPALQQKGWAVSVNMREEYYFTDGRVLVVGNQHSVAEGKKADYLLYHNGKPIAVVEAKDNKHAVGGGIQQAMDYAQILDLKFAYSSNGDAFLEHDFITGKETEIKLENFPTEEELYNRYLASKNYTSDELNIIETPFYYDAHSHEPRYYQRIAVDRTVEAIARGQQRVLVVWLPVLVRLSLLSRLSIVSIKAEQRKRFFILQTEISSLTKQWCKTSNLSRSL